MLKLASFILELLRMCVLLILTLLILGGLERLIYSIMLGTPLYNWSMGIGNIVLFFILYRNYFQFMGWYKSVKNQRLSTSITRSLAVISMILIIIPIWVAQ